MDSKRTTLSKIEFAKNFSLFDFIKSITPGGKAEFFLTLARVRCDLKPLFSFAGLGVKIDVTKKMLDEIKDPENYILQEKVEYTPLIETPDEYAKVEIRMMYFYDKQPILVNNLVRQSKGKMMGVDFNKNKTWVGGSAALHSK